MHAPPPGSVTARTSDFDSEGAGSIPARATNNKSATDGAPDPARLVKPQTIHSGTVAREQSSLRVSNERTSERHE